MRAFRRSRIVSDPAIATRHAKRPKRRWSVAGCVKLAVILGSMLAIDRTPNSLAAQNLDTEKPVAPLPTDPATVIAVVGETPILLGELMMKVDGRIKELIEKAGQEPTPEQMVQVRKNLVRGLLVQTIQNKMLRESFLLTQVGTQAHDARVEADAKLTQKARQMFREKELPELMKQYECDDVTELNDRLIEKGSSLGIRQRDFVDMMLGHLYVREKVDREPNVTVAEIVDAYRRGRDEYSRPERATWEQLSAHIDEAGSKKAAFELITAMAREAYYGGNLRAVAKRQSHDAYAAQGGVHDWTARGSLVSEKLDTTVFTIPLNKMSEIIEDERGYHVVRVMDRQPAGLIPLAEVRDEIRAAIRKEKVARSQEEAMKSMHEKIPVWSLYPDDFPDAMPMPMPKTPTGGPAMRGPRP